MNSSNIKYVFWIAIHFANFIPIYLTHRYCFKKRKWNEEKNNTDIISQNILMLLMIPFYYFDPVFLRVYRPLQLNNFIYISNMLKKGIRQDKFALGINIYQVFLLLGTFLIMYVLLSDFNAMVITIFENNLFLNIFK